MFYSRIVMSFFVTLFTGPCVPHMPHVTTSPQEKCAFQEEQGIAPPGFEVVYGGYGITLKEPDRLGLAYLRDLCPGDRVLDLGAGLGVHTLPALEREALVTVNDLSEENLCEIWRRCTPALRKNLFLKQGHFPSALTFPKDYFDVIIAFRVIQFLSGAEIEKGVNLLYRWLKPKNVFRFFLYICVFYKTITL